MDEGAMITQGVTFAGNGGDQIDGYYARPAGEGPFPGVIVIQHIFGVDEWIMEVCRRFAHHGYAALAPNLYARIGSLGQGSVEDVAARLRSLGGLNDEVVVGDLRGALEKIRSFPESSGKAGTIGFCMGGRFAYLAACKIPELSAAIDCWGGGVAPDLSQPGNPPGTPVVNFTQDMSVPLLGLFGNDDSRPNPAEVDRTEAALKQHNKPYEFHRYDGAAHAFFSWSGINFRPMQARDGWERVWSFLEKHLHAPVEAASRS